jgi:hypothetical protein
MACGKQQQHCEKYRSAIFEISGFGGFPVQTRAGNRAKVILFGQGISSKMNEKE